jgi:anaerobic selenocysteine-containing dehydrogenase/Fe-S-cluster-containing dehydrogenase component
MTEGMNRRRFLKILGVTGGGAAALSGCGIGPEPAEKLIPYLVAPDDQIPGIATWYATTCRECAAGCGLRARVREGRVVKLEGNPDSPVNRGRLCARGQAGLQGLYNPDRLTAPRLRSASGQLEEITWDKAIQLLSQRIADARGKGIVFVTGHETGTFGDLVDVWMRAVGGRRVTFEPFALEALREGNHLAFGTSAVPFYDFAAARYIVSFGADFMETWLSPVGFQNAFTRAHAFAAGADSTMAKYVYVGPRLSQTGLSADEWIAAAPGSEGILALAMAQVILSRRLAAAPADAGRLVALLTSYAPEKVAGIVGLDAKTIERLAREFAASKPGLAVAGGVAAQYAHGAEIVAAVNLLNYVAGNVGRTVKFGPDLAQDSAGRYRELAALRDDMSAGRVAVLLVHGANPAHADAGFAQGMGKVGFKVSFASYPDETAGAADLVLPDLHPLEQWNDARPRAGVFALQQPVMAPVFPNALHAGDVILRVAGRPGTFHDYLQAAWRDVHRRYGGGKSFEDFWNGALQRGGVYTDVPARAVRLAADVARAMPEARAFVPSWTGAFTTPLVVFPHPALHDGRGANKPWLQELPDPVSKITWHGWVEVHPETAEKWGVVNGDVVSLKSSAGEVRAPVWATPSVRPDTIAAPTGQGHVAYGRYAAGRSFNAFDLLPGSPNSYGGRTFVVAVSVTKTGEHVFLATTEGNAREHGQGIVNVLPLSRARHLRAGEHAFEEEEVPAYARSALEGWAEAQHEMASLGNYAGQHPRWALAIDLSRCTGCSACVTACYAENNLATVGPELVRRHREMSWMRIERYFTGGSAGEPLQAVTTPMLCQQCGNAPCEPVCPVYAAYHTPDGLNGQVYNRCVGTRYCSNNCPYKVRYFNWYNYAEPGGAWEAWPEPLQLLLNPDVTVREKGVMEKCTFCVQRIRGKQNDARLADRKLDDAELQFLPACAQGCPSEAIVFGDLNDPASRVRQLADNPRAYHVLAGLNTRPGVSYLAKVTAAGAT